MSDYIPSVATHGNTALVKDHILNRQIDPKYVPKSQKKKKERNYIPLLL